MTQQRKHMLAITLVAASGLLLEISLTNLLASIYFPPYVFAVIAMAVLGIGLGAALAAAKPALQQSEYTPVYALLALVTTCVLTLFAVFGVRYAFSQQFLFVFVTLPFICVGLLVTTLFSQNRDKSNILYMADLLGAGMGALLAVVMMNQVGATNSVLAAGVGFGIVALILDEDRLFNLILALTLLMAIALAANMVGAWLRVDMATLHIEKPITDVLAGGGVILDTHEDAFARTDVVDPRDGSPIQIYVNGAAASVMPPAGMDENLIRDIGFFPFATTRPQNVFIIGPGGGLDVWFALHSGAAEITAVEVNEASNAFVRQYAPYNGNLYAQPQVTVIADDGRRVLSRSDEQYDLIFLSQVVTLVAERNSYVLSENTIYTVEAFQQYLDHLTPSGHIALKLYDEITLTRAVSTAIAAFNERGLSDREALQQMVVLLDSRVNPPVPLLMIRNTPYSRDTAALLAAFANDLEYTPLLLPPSIVQSPLDDVTGGLLTFADIVARSQNDLSAPTDNRPYFFQFEQGIPGTLQQVVVGITLVIVVGLGLLYGMLRNEKSTIPHWMMLYFAMLGIGFIAVEIVIIQQTRLVLGHPTFALTLVLTVLLIGGGIGSGLAHKIGTQRLIAAPLAVLMMLVVWIVLWSLLQDSLLEQKQLMSAVITALTILPVGIVLGMPFPLGLLYVARLDSAKYIALAWAINGVMTVAGTILTLTVSMLWGFQMVIGLAICAYGVVAITSRVITVKA